MPAIAHPIAALALALCLVAGAQAQSQAQTEDWHALCDPEGNQPALNACAFAARDEAQARLDAVRAAFAEAYADDPALQVERVAALDAAQSLWEADRDRQLDALFPLAAGEEAAVMYGSSYPMSFAFAWARLTAQRAEFLADFWLPL